MKALSVIVIAMLASSLPMASAQAEDVEVRKAYTPKAAHELWVEYGHAGNLDAMLTLYETDGTIWDIGSGKALTTPEERRAFLREFLDTISYFHLETASVTLNGAGDVALLRSKWYAEGVSEDDAGKRAEWTSRNCGSEVVRKQADGSWLFIVDNPYAATSWDACPSY